jgi:hypothetical protein
MTENWRVKIAMSCGGTLPPHFGTAISLPFSLTAVTTTCCLRSMPMTASFESATNTPVWSCPDRFLPFHSNVGMSPPYYAGRIGRAVAAEGVP